jgi:hypothetical protein
MSQSAALKGYAKGYAILTDIMGHATRRGHFAEVTFTFATPGFRLNA